MDCHTNKEEGKRYKARHGEGYKKVALVGAPNVGKSVIFGLLTGRYVTVSNYPGTTVEVFQGNVFLDGQRFLLVDTPGVNSLLPMSEDEKVTRDILLDERPEAVIQVGDSKNLKRTLSLTIQLAEMGLPIVLNLNMEDEARDRGITIDYNALGELIGTTIVSTVAPERKGLKELKASISDGEARVPALSVYYGETLEEYIENVSFLLPDANISKRSLAIMILSGDQSMRDWLNQRLALSVIEEIEALKDDCARKLTKSVGVHIGEVRFRLASEITDRVVEQAEPVKGSIPAFIGKVSMHPLWGLPVLLLVLFGLYEFVGVFGADILVGLLEETVFGNYLNPMFTKVVETLVPFGIIQDMLVGEYGQITMALTYAIGIILPITTTFFVAFSILEDSGYLPRLAIMSNRIFKMIGLSGRAVLPMVLGLGCGTMAVMTTRILESRRERIIATFLLALAVPCAAQLGVIMGMLGGLSLKAMLYWIFFMLVVLVVTGFLAARVIPGERPEFFLEIPPIRAPRLGNVLVKTWGRAMWYLKEAVPLFMLGTFALFVLDRVRVLDVIVDFASPVVVGILDLPPKATEAFLIGFFRRDYGAAGLFHLAEKGMLDPVQTMVSLFTLTLFVPCLAHFFMMIKERGWKMAFLMMLIIIPIAISIGGILNWALRTFDISLVQ
jgi:ferrous iron transport protein B